ncbi:MAG: M56 family metallopeptidase [Planctomycetota bacterium]
MPQIDTPFVQLVWQQFWQCSLLVLAVYLICRLIRFRRSHLTFILWLIVLLKFMTPPVWSSSSGLFCWVQESLTATAPENPKQPEQHSLTLTESIRLLIGDDLSQLPDVDPNASRMKVTVHDGTAFEQRDRASETVAVLPESVVNESGQPAFEWTLIDVAILSWAFVAALIMAVMGIRYARCWMILRRAGEQHRPDLDQLLARLCAELHLKRRVRLIITNSRMGPAVIGLFRPTIILPTAITDARSLQELEPILAHELIHIRRGDLWIGLLQLLASVVWWFHPLVWFTGRRLKFEIEQCCDEEVLAELNCDPRLYAKSLLEVLELKQTLNAVPVVPGVRPVEITSKRLERIMKLGQGCQKRTPWWCWMIFITLAAVVLPGAAFVVTAADQADSPLMIDEIESTVVSQPNQLEAVPQTIRPNPGSPEKSSFAKETGQKMDSPQISSYPIGGLLKAARDDAETDVSQAEFDLLQKIRLTINEERRKLDQKRNRSGKKNSKTAASNGSDGILIFNDHLMVVSDDPVIHQQVAQALQMISESTAAQVLITAKIISVPRKLLKTFSTQQKYVRVNESISAHRKNPEMNRLKHHGIEFQESESERIIPFETEVTKQSIVCETLDVERSEEIEKLLQSNSEIKYLSRPAVTMLNGRSSQVEVYFTPVASVAKVDLNEKGLAVIKLELQPRIPETAEDQTGFLEYQLTVSGKRGLITPNALDLETGQEKTVEVPLYINSRYEDSAQIKWGQTLLLGVGNLPHVMSDSEALLVMLHVVKVKPLEESEVMQLQGVGVNSDAGVTGTVLFKESNAKETLVTVLYRVADLVVPIQRNLAVPGKQPGPVPPMLEPRFEPLIELIKQNVTPEAWGDFRENYSTIRPYPKMLSLVVRHTLEGHDELAELLDKLRAVQDRQVCLEVQLITADDLPAWLETWNKSASPVTQDLWTLLKTKQLDEGIQLSSKQRGLLMQMSERGEHVNRQHVAKVTTFNGQPAVLNLFGLLPPDETPKTLVQLRPELLQNQRLRLSFVINPQNALDTISHLKNATIPEGQSLLVDITDQLSRDDSSYQFDQFVRQAELSYQKQTKRCLLLVTPNVLNVSEAVEQRATPPSR